MKGQVYMKKQSWTLAEMVIAMTILAVLSLFVVSSIKGNKVKNNIFIYSALRNIMKGNSYIITKYADVSNFADLPETVNGDEHNDGYCMRLADAFSLQANPNCAYKNGDTLISDSDLAKTVNIRFPNSVTIQGLSNKWRTDGNERTFKNIVVDINGEEGPNKIGSDRFPVRIYDGLYRGIATVVNCDDDASYNSEGTRVELEEETGKSPYCVNGFNLEGAEVSTNIAADASSLAYNVYKPQDSSENARASLVAFALSFMEADCAAHGGTGFFSKEQCQAKAQVTQTSSNHNRYRLRRECATADICSSLTNSQSNVLPLADDDDNAPSTDCSTLASANNPENLLCITVLKKPSTGTSMILDTAIQGLFMD